MIQFRNFVFLFLVLAVLSVVAVSAQETETKVVDEVVAQVNNDVITLSRVKREMKSAVDSFVQEGKSPEEAKKLIDEKQGELIANLINEELLVQKAKDAGIEKDIEASLNQRVVELMKQYNFKTVEQLYAEMEKSGIDPQEMRESWRKQATRERVIQNDIQSKLYWGFSSKELKDYYEAHKNKFTKPETISFSEIFLGFAGRDEATVKQKAQSIYDQLKAGGDFDKLAKENSDTGVITQGTGKAEKLQTANLVETLTKPLTGVKVGEYTKPFELDKLGMAILRVDAREQASNQSEFDEKAVRLAMLNERFPDEQKKYMAKLRDDAYIKISDAYRPIVSPILFADERKDKVKN